MSDFFSKICIFEKNVVLLRCKSNKTMAQTREEMIKEICGRKPKHRFINTSFGEVKLVGGFNYSTQEHFCEVYIGDNFDQYVCEIDCNILDDEENILQQIEEKLYY